MKKKILVFVMFLGVLLQASCANKDVESEKQSKDTLRMAMFTEIDSLDPFKNTAGDTVTVMNQIFDGLLDVDEDGNMISDLAESYTISDDGKTYDFKLKKDVLFHDGNKMTAEDVYYTYANLAGLYGFDKISDKYSVIESIEVVDDYSIKFHLNNRRNGFIYLCNYPILEKDYKDNNTKPIGTGPYQFVSYTPGEGLKLKKFDQYHNKDHLANIENIDVIKVADRQSLLMALNNGDIDLGFGLDANEVSQVKESCDIVSQPQNLVQVMGLNNDFEPFQDIRVRQALNYAIDRDQIVESLSKGNAVKLYSSFSPALKEYFNDLGDFYPRDVEKAKELLKEAGYEDLSFKVTVPSDYKFHMDTAELVEQQLKEAGITMQIEPIDFGTWTDKVYKKRDFEATIVGFIGYLDPIQVLGRYQSTSEKNYINYKSDDFDKAIENAEVAENQDKYIENIKTSQEILAKDAASVFIQDPNYNEALNKNLTGLKAYPIQKINLEDIKVKND